MANEEQLARLRGGVDGWNRWLEDYPGVAIDLAEADLAGAGLAGAKLMGADLRQATLDEADLREAHLRNADLRQATLNNANLRGAKLFRADLRGADLWGATLIDVDLRGADPGGAKLWGAFVIGARLTGATFDRSLVGWTVFANVDLGAAEGLETVDHFGPSTLDIDTVLYHSGGTIPEVFLRGVGLPDTFIDYAASLVGKPIEYYSCFISYSSKDEAFAKRLYADLQANGERCWFAPEDLPIGAKTRVSIDEAIRLHDKLLLVLSARSVASDWVEKEVEAAFERERRERRLVLFPVRLDDAVMGAPSGWAADIRRARNIGDFRRWKRHDAYQAALARLLRDLKATDGADAPTPPEHEA